MSSVALLRRGLGVAGLCILLGGCSPTAESRFDEQRDPNYLAGKRRLEGMDYSGAVESFERAIEANPRSASAHYELAVVCYENTKDWAASIYHFDKYLKLEPKSGRADVVRQLIMVCKQELAKGSPLTSLSDKEQRELANTVGKLTNENNELKLQIDQLKAELTQRAASGSASVPIPNVRTGAVIQVQQSLPPRSGPPGDRPSPPASHDSSLPAPAARTHIVRAGDTPASVARSYGVALASLLSANPEVEPRRMKPGQTLRIPLR